MHQLINLSITISNHPPRYVRHPPIPGAPCRPLLLPLHPHHVEQEPPRPARLQGLHLSCGQRDTAIQSAKRSVFTYRVQQSLSAVSIRSNMAHNNIAHVPCWVG
jgi:hypothetical protein